MSFSANRVIVAGNLVRDPEQRQVGADRTVAHFTLAINNRYKGADGEVKDSPVFLDCEAWGKTSELVCQYLTKGSGAYLEGRLKQDNWQDKDGQKRTKIKLVADLVRFTGSPRANGDEAAGEDEPAAGASPAAGQSGASRPPRPSAPVRTPRPPVHSPAAGIDTEPPF